MAEISIIGVGNMGSAMIEGLSLSDRHRVTACGRDPAHLDTIAAYCAETTTEIAAAATADVVVVAVKPGDVAGVLEDLDLSPDQTLVSVAAGVPLAYLAARTDAAVVRVMPNLAAATGDTAAAVAGETVGDDVRAMLEDLGEYVVIEERLMDVATALNGSGPAFVFYLVGAMRDAAVAEGMDAADAETLAAQTAKGAAETVLRSDRSVGELIDAVCSPNGTTIEGMAVLRDSDVDAVLGDALAAAADRSRELAEAFDDE